ASYCCYQLQRNTRYEWLVRPSSIGTFTLQVDAKLSWRTINNLEKGDLVFFMTNPVLPNQVSHVGIYIGNNKFIHSPNAYDVIKISELTGYYKDKFVIGKRLIKYT
ncbi:MAG: C40 family peptidase, partial [Clostridium sp.]|uniref:C40 family peptidase n=1 Tax=Clostridium sp. TaxID=1506 RepID=UPI003D6CD4A0